MKRKALGDILVEMGALDEHQLQSALAHHRQWGMPIGQAVLDKRFCSKETVLRALSRQAMLPVIDLSREDLDSRVAALLPKKAAEQHRAVPIRVEGAKNETLVVAIAAPASLESLDELKAVSGKRRLSAYLADDGAIERAFGRIYLGYDKADERAATEPVREIAIDNEVEFDLTAQDGAEKEKTRPVMVYGWTDEAGRTMALILAADGIDAKVVTAQEVLACQNDDVIVAPLPAMEAIVPHGQRAPGRLVVAGKVPEDDLPRAQLLGALGFIAAPVDTGLLLRAVRRCQALSASRPAAGPSSAA